MSISKEVNGPSSEGKIVQIRNEIIQKELTILDFVEKLGPQLQNSEPSERENGLNELIDVLILLPVNFLTKLEVQHLVEFFCARLTDSSLLNVPLVKALHYLTSLCINIPDQYIESLVIRSLVREQQVQAFPADDRFLIFQIIDFFLFHRISGIRQLGPEFILAFMQAIEGERDPRCLIMVFKCFYTVMTKLTFSVDTFSSDLFELVACYFPIDFNPPENDPYGITRKQLCNSLSQCLTCHSSFGPLCLDLLVETLSENVEIDKETCEESFKLLLAAYENFAPEIVSAYSSGLWNGMRGRAFAVDSYNQFQIELTQTFVNALTGLFTIVNSVSKNDNNDKLSPEMTSLLDRAIHDCEPFLLNSEMGLSSRVCSFLRPVASLSKDICSRICSKILFRVIDYSMQESSVPTLAAFCWIAVEMNTADKAIPQSGPCRSTLSGLLFDNLKREPNLNIKRLLHLFEIAEALAMAGYHWTYDEKRHIIETAADAFCENESKEIRDTCIKLIRLMARRLESEEWDELESAFQMSTNQPSMLSILVQEKASAEVCLPKIIRNVRESSNESEFVNAVEALVNVFKWNLNSSEVLVFCWKSALEILLEKASERPIDCSWNGGPIAVAIQEIYLCMSNNIGKEFLQFALDRVLEADESFAQLLSACKILIISIPLEESLEVLDKVENKLLPTIQVDQNISLSLISYRILCSLLNKSPPDRPDRFYQLFAQLDAVTDVHCFRIVALCRSCLLRNKQPEADNCLIKYFGLLEDDTTALSAIENLCLMFAGFLGGPFEQKRTHMRITLLYRQRMFSQCVSAFLHRYNLTEKRKRCYYFAALAEMLKSAPVDGLQAEFLRLEPVLTLALQQHETTFLLPVVSTFDRILSDKQTAGRMDKHIDSIVSRLLVLANEQNTKEVRLVSIKCLESICKQFPLALLQPLRSQVLRCLAKTLNDRKRIVRQQASHTRNLWFLLV